MCTPRQIAGMLSHSAALTDVRGRQRHTFVATLRYPWMRSGELRTLRRQRVALLRDPLMPVLRPGLTEVRSHVPDSPLLLANAHPFVTTAQHGCPDGRPRAGGSSPPDWPPVCRAGTIRTSGGTPTPPSWSGAAGTPTWWRRTHIVSTDG